MSDRHPTPTPRRFRTAGSVAAVALCLVAASCGGSSVDGPPNDEGAADACLAASCGESGLEDAGEPVRGGTLVYGLSGESNGGFCLPEAQLAISGEMVVHAIYDTLTAPNAEGDYVPYLAESVTPNDDATEWTIELRDGITFHDGTPLTGEVVKNNLDAYRGTYPGRSSLLFTFVLSNIDDVAADGQTVTVTTKVPWAAFPAFLYSSNRMGIMAQAQLDDPESCDRKLIGTGPFVFDDWKPNDRLTATRNADYWQTAPDGEAYPYADAIEFRILVETQVRLNSLSSDDGANVIHTTNGEAITVDLVDARDRGDANLFVSSDWAEVSFIQLNSTMAPFDDIRMRKALAMGLDREAINDNINNGFPELAEGPFAPGSDASIRDTGYPARDVAAATALVEDYVADGGSASFTLTTGNDPLTIRYAELVQQGAKQLGMDIRLVQRDQAAIINDAIGRNYQAQTFQNYPGGDPDLNHIWWYGNENPVNFGGYDDPDINRLLDEGRSEPDPAARTEIYQDISRVFGEQVYSVWMWLAPWAIATDESVHGILGPPLPGDDPSQPGEPGTDDPARQPNTGLATGHALIGMWIEP